MALINYAMSFLVRRGFTPVQTPFFMRKARLPRGDCAIAAGVLSTRAVVLTCPNATGVHERVRSARGLRRAALQGTPVSSMRFFVSLVRVCALCSCDLRQVSGEGDEKYLIATSEQTLCSMLRHKWIDPKACPMRLAGYSTCFRKEVRTLSDSPN